MVVVGGGGGEGGGGGSNPSSRLGIRTLYMRQQMDAVLLLLYVAVVIFPFVTPGNKAE